MLTVIKDPSLGLRAMLFSAALDELYRQNWLVAKELLSKIIFIWPNDYVALEERAFCYYSSKQKVSALLELRRTEKAAAANEGYLHFIYSRQYWMKKNFPAAVRQVEKAIELSPNEPRFRHFRGFLEREFSGNIEAELAIYDDLLARFPKYTRLHVTYNNMGFLKYLKEDLPGAIADYKKSIEMCPKHIRAFYNLTLSLTDERRFDEALETIEAAKLINPSQLDSYHSLKGWVLQHVGRYVEASENYKQALDADITDLSTTTDVHQVWLYQGRTVFMTQVFAESIARINADLENCRVKRLKIEEKLQSERFRNFNWTSDETSREYIDAYMDVDQEERALNKAWRLNNRFYAESLVLLGRLSEAQKIHQEVKTRMPSSDPEEVKDDFYLDFFFEQMNSKLHSISPKAVELVSKLIGMTKFEKFPFILSQLKATLNNEADLAYFMYSYIYKMEELGEPMQPEDEHLLSTMDKGRRFLESIEKHKMGSDRSEAIKSAFSIPGVLVWQARKMWSNAIYDIPQQFITTVIHSYDTCQTENGGVDLSKLRDVLAAAINQT
jgi:tetratricopeptide (TPR) repeat protein